MFLALPTWLDQSSRVTLLDPTYGEYQHILDHVVGCEVDALPLRRDEGYAVDIDALERSAAESDLLILVNPNSPTGLHVARSELVQLLDAVPATTRPGGVGMRPSSDIIVTLLPEPLSPTTPRNSPARSSKPTPFTA